MECIQYTSSPEDCDDVFADVAHLFSVCKTFFQVRDMRDRLSLHIRYFAEDVQYF